MWYFLEGYIDRMQNLARAGIIVMEAQIREPKEATGIAFPAEARNQVMAHLGLTDLAWADVPTNTPGTRLLQQTGRTKTGGETADMTVYMQEQEASRRYRPVLTKIADDFGINIKCMVPHGNSAPPEGRDGTLHVYIWSTPVYSEKTQLRTVYGKHLEGGTADAMPPSGRGTIIYDDARTPVAEVSPWNIYVLFDITHTDGYQDVFERILREALPTALPRDWNDRIRERFEEQLKRREADEVRMREEFKRNLVRAREQYVAVCTSRLKGAADEKRKLVDKNEKLVDDLTRQLIAASRDLEVLRAELSGLEGGAKAPTEKIGAEFDQLTKHPDIERIEVEGRTIKVFTGPITIRHNRMKYEMGKYEIEISVDGGVRFFSPRYPRNAERTAIHPHIYQGGGVCWGMLENEVPKLLRRQEYAVLVNLLLNFLQGFNPAHSWRHIDNWKGVPE